MRLFIADDSQIVCSRIATLLADINAIEIIGYAHTSPSAIRSIGQLKPDAVILDLQLAGGSGVEVLRSIKKLEPSPLVLVLTNHFYPQYEKTCREAGADYFLDKSTDFQKIFDLIRNLSGGRP